MRQRSEGGRDYTGPRAQSFGGDADGDLGWHRGQGPGHGEAGVQRARRLAKENVQTVLYLGQAGLEAGDLRQRLLANAARLLHVLGAGEAGPDCLQQPSEGMIHASMTGRARLIGSVMLATALGGCSLPGPQAGRVGTDAAAPDAREAPALPDTAPPSFTTDGGAVVPVAISAGLWSTCALLSDGTVRCWGYNEYGQLGNGTHTESIMPVPVEGVSNAIALSASAGYHVCVVLADRTARCWGTDYDGALGDGSEIDSTTIKRVSGLSGVTSISTGGNAGCATLLDQTVHCWGGLPGGVAATSPLTIPLGGVTQVQVGSGIICALLADGTVRCWGDNSSGEIGDGTYGDSMHPVTTPTEVKGLGQVVALSAGYSFVCAVLADRTAACWGQNLKGQLGNGTVTVGPPSGIATPVSVSGLTNVVEISASNAYACALLGDGTVFCWGDNQDGTLGNGTTSDSPTPVAVAGLTDIVGISAGAEHACALGADGTIWCWGLNSEGELGSADAHESCYLSAVCSRTPVRVEWGTSLDGGLPTTEPPRDAAADLPLGSDGGLPCRLGSDCASLGGTFCQKDSCDPDAPGVCTLIPGTRSSGYCQLEDDLVCGCDGKTYPYPCIAHAQAVNVASHGACPLPDGGAPCASNADCATGLYCKTPTCAAASGVCTGEPDFQACYAELDKTDGGVSVCGCDHVTYASDCMAASYGTNVDFTGPCPPLPSGPCTSLADCGGDSYTALVFCMPTICGQAAGQCTALPGACPGLVRPVCGCDGRQYTNSCFAEQAHAGWYDSDGGCP
jgi:alpha-tubulin suppressor-like RCC1 family protein